MRVLICDDHPLFRDGMAMLLRELGFEVVGGSSSGEEAVADAERLRPDVVLMDLQLPGINGIQATSRIVTADPRVRVLVVTMFDDEPTVAAALRAGAHGYLLKGATHEVVRSTLEAVVRGDLVVSGPAARGLRERLSGPAATLVAGLSRRESEILDLLARGYSNERIAASLFLSPKTVSNNVSAILAKMGATSRAHAVAIARDAQQKAGGG
jgi:DNA-binding NarL/FixJ family response regulator